MSIILYIFFIKFYVFTIYSINNVYYISKKAYIDGSKRIGRKIFFAAVFIDITKRGALLEEALIHTDTMTAIKYIQTLRVLYSPLNTIKKSSST